MLWILGIVSSLGLVGTVVAVVAVPGIAVPILKGVSGAILKCKPCMAVLAAIALLFTGALYGAHVEGARAEARLEKARRAAAAAAGQRDEAVAEDLRKTYQPRILTLAKERDALQQKVDEHAKRKPAARTGKAGKTGASCKLGDAADLLRPPRKPR